ncbi:MAG: Gfo/Idh/MocA family oxidoreductase [Pirellulaceae bacterium]|nr:Gfo/Idh/MocA family oxidoreductase [Pirellulaceae bacterium]
MTSLPTNSRRKFIQSTAAVAAGATFLPATATAGFHASGSDVLKVGLIGCGSRGNGAAKDAIDADKNAKLTAICDIFPDKLEQAKSSLKRSLKDQYDVDDANCFSDFDGYKQLLATDVDVVLLTTPPYFRPKMLEAAVAAGKHVFCEKPVAVDGAGVRSVLETSRKAKEKNLNIVSGLCWRYDTGVLETMKRIQDGAIGDVVAIQNDYLTSELWYRTPKPDWTKMENQIRNWLYYTWLSGDHINEQHIHSLDKSVWLNGDQPPATCYGLGGRQKRTSDRYGHIYDHFAICFEWENGVKAFSYTRQMTGCHSTTEDHVLGTKGKAQVLRHKIEGPNSWSFRDRKASMYKLEHVALFDAIRSGKALNNGEYMSYSTLMAIMGREACYTGKRITSEDALNDTTVLGPEELAWTNDVPDYPVAIPGGNRTRRRGRQ